MTKSWVRPGSETMALHQKTKWQSYLYMYIKKCALNFLFFFPPAENTGGTNLRCLTRNEWVKGERNNEEMWCQRWRVLQTQWGAELLKEGDWVRYRLPFLFCGIRFSATQITSCFLLCKTICRNLWVYAVTSFRLWFLDVQEIAVIKHI